MVDAAATFSIDLEGSAPAFSKETAKSLEALRGSVKSSQDSIRQYSETLRGLTGKSQEVTDAKTRLKAAIDREKATMSGANVEILKMGSNYGKLAAEAKKASAANDNGVKSIKAIGGPLQGAIEKFEGMKEALGGASLGMSLLAGGAAILAIAVVAVTTALVTGAIALGKWIVEGADAARTLNLVREAATGSAENAKNLGTHVDQLARKVPTAKKELNDLASDLYRRFNNTAASGQVIVDTFNIIAQSSEAMGKTVGNQLGDIIERSKRFGRVRINPFELQGTGVKFEDVAKNLAKQTGVSIEAARKALFEGRVKLDAGAAALRKTVEDRFGEVNARKLLSLDVIFNKWHEALASLTSGVKLEPLSKAIGDFFHLFDSSTVTGVALKQLVEIVGNQLVGGLTKSEPILKQFFKKAVIYALDLEIEWLKMKKLGKEAFSNELLDSLKTMLELLGKSAQAMVALVKAAGQLYEWDQKITGFLGDKAGALGIGPGAEEEPASGAPSQAPQIVPSSIKTLRAPGHAKGGMVTAVPAPGEGFASVAPGESIVPAGAGGKSSIALTVHFHIGGGADGKKVAKDLASPSILAPLVKALEDALVAAGFPVQTVPQS